MIDENPIKEYPISLYRYRLEYETDSDFHSPEFLGSFVRSTFGMVFRQLACTTKMSSCIGCSKIAECSYQLVFESASIGTTPGYISNAGKIPHPFILHAPWGKPILYTKGASFSFELTLMREAKRFLPLIVYAFKVMGEKGLGRERSKLILKSIYNVRGLGKKVVCYSSHDDLLNTESETIEYGDYERIKNEKHRIELFFRTPLRIQQNKQIIQRPEQVSAELILRAAQRRYHTLHHYYGEGKGIEYLSPIDVKNISCDTRDLHWRSNQRYSARAETEMDLGGFIGRVILGGEIESYLPYLYMNQYINLGKNTAFGLGEVVIL